MEENVEFIDAEAEFNPNKGVTIRDIVFAHLGKISTLCTKEFTVGYWVKKPIATSGGVYMSETYHEDNRKAYINAVDFLHDLLFPKFNTDEQKELDIIERELDLDKKSDEEDWITNKLLNRRKIFRRLSSVLKRLNYLEADVIM